MTEERELMTKKYIFPILAGIFLALMILVAFLATSCTRLNLSEVEMPGSKVVADKEAAFDFSQKG